MTENIIHEDEFIYVVDKDGIKIGYEKPQHYKVTSGSTAPIPTVYINELREEFSNCNHEWVKCSYKMPPSENINEHGNFSVNCLCIDKNKDMFVGRYNFKNNSWRETYGCDDMEPTHWMMLPEVPNELD